MSFSVSDHENGIVVLTISSAEGNSLNTIQLRQLASVLTECGGRAELRVLILTGANGTFCRGRIGAKGLTHASDVAEDLNAILEVNAALDALEVPLVVAAEGQAFGFAFGLTAQSDYAIAAEDAVFALPEMSHGLPPLIVFSYLFRFVPFKRAVELSLTSREVSAHEAATAGIVTEVVRSGGALARALELGKLVASMDKKSIALFRKFSRQAAGAYSQQLSEYAVSTMSILLADRARELNK